MYHAVKSQAIGKLLVVEGPALIVSIAIANTFYKFGSFLLELLAFLPTWFVVSLIISSLLGRLQMRERQ
jgi:hypothetical protein